MSTTTSPSPPPPSPKPGDPGTQPGFVIGPNGTEISEYEYKRYLKIQRNTLHIQKLGLETMKKNLRENKKQQQQQPRRKVIRTKTLEKRRMSLRVREQTLGNRRTTRQQQYAKIESSSEDSIVTLDRLEIQIKKRRAEKRYSSASSGKFQVRNLTPDERETLRDVRDWVEDMEFFMKHELGNSVANVKQTMMRVRILVGGEGIEHPRTGSVFRKGIKVNLGDDFGAIHLEATDWVNENGGDSSHGWLVHHPVKKIWTYQVRRFERGGKPFCS